VVGPTRPIEVAPKKMLELASCFQPDHIIAELAGSNRNTVIEELANLASSLGLVKDKTWFMGALIERENVMPSAVGNGLAFLHTLRRNPDQVVKPFMVLGRSTRGVDFDALDGKPTHLLFVLGLKYAELHLPWLHKLSQIFAGDEAIRAVLEASDAEAIYSVVDTANKKLEPIAARAS
jgi:nitrogen PTS system EIIA component